MNLLSIHNVKKHFGGVKAVDGCSSQIKSQTITGLIGPNGAGKTTLFNLTAGFHKPDDGRVVFKGKNIESLPPFKIAREGLVKTFQITHALSKMTVLENMMLSQQGQSGEKMWNVLFQRKKIEREERENREKALDMLSFFGLVHLKDAYAGTLSGGQKKLLEMARALMLEPDMLLLDEPFAGVNPTLATQLCQYIADLKDKGLTFLIIEHDIPMITRISDGILVMNQGKILAEGTPEEIKGNKEVLEAYLGGGT